MGAPIGNCNAAKNKVACKKGMRRAYKALKKIEKLEIAYHTKHGTLRTFNTAIRTSKPKIAEYVSRKKRLTNYLKYL